MQSSDDTETLGMGPVDDGGELLRQAKICRDMGSPFTANILEAARRNLASGPLTARKIMNWKGNRGHAAVALRLAGGFHALARQGVPERLAALYRVRVGDFDGAVAQALARHDEFLCDWIDSVPQTNEVGRAGAIMAALLVVAERFGLPFELLELGSSAGLNLNLHHYAHDLGGVRTGDPASDVLIRPDWRGPHPPAAMVDVQSARGVDLEPVDLTDPDNAERLMAYVWADREERMTRLERAIALARAFPPMLDAGDAVPWIARALAKRPEGPKPQAEGPEPQAEGVVRVIFHSIVLQYIPDEGRARIRAAIEAAGARANRARPLAWISFEWDAARSVVFLTLSMWPAATGPGCDRLVLATCHPHAAWIDWHGSTGAL